MEQILLSSIGDSPARQKKDVYHISFRQGLSHLGRVQIEMVRLGAGLYAYAGGRHRHFHWDRYR